MSIIKQLERLIEGEKRKHHHRAKHETKRKRTPPRKANGEFRKRKKG